MPQIQRDTAGIAHLVALSGGKDSTAMALRLQETSPQTPYTYFFTPTGDELPDVSTHYDRLRQLLVPAPVISINPGKTLASLISQFHALPNWRQRWCTRILKIEPAIQFAQSAAPAVMYVGLRYDEESRGGIYGNLVSSAYPLRDWGWRLEEVTRYLKDKNICIPERTDCARCYGQRLYEWRRLSQRFPEIYEDAIRDEETTGNTFRSPGRDTWPTRLLDLRQEFQIGRKIRGEDKTPVCRVCRM